METNNQIVKKDEGQQSFIERLVEKAGSLEDIKKVGEVIIASGFCPDHFKTSKDSVGVIMCIEAGKQLGMSWMQALSDLYPVRGRIGMMGDAAVALIMGSGVLEYWKEETSGTYPNNDYKHVIRSKRKGFPNENVSEFSVFDAATAGLMQKDIYKKYGKRMIAYRNKGFHARDFYADIMKGMKTVEELNDYDPNLLAGEGNISITTKGGKEIKVPANAEEKSENLSSSVSNLIDKANGGKPDVQDAVIVPDKPAEEQAEHAYTEAELRDMKEGVYELLPQLLPEAKVKIITSLPRRKSVKQYIEGILAFQDGKLDQWITSQISRTDSDNKDEKPEVPEVAPQESAPIPTPNVDTDDIDRVLETKPGNISTKEATESFMAQGKSQASQESFEISEVGDNGKRNFSSGIKLKKYLEEMGIADGSVASQGYANLWDFCERAKKQDVEVLIQKNM